MNFIFISPNFPKSYWNFCRGLKNNGVNTLGIGDADYDFLSDELKESLNEYYKVSSLETMMKCTELVLILLLSMEKLIG